MKCQWKNTDLYFETGCLLLLLLLLGFFLGGVQKKIRKVPHDKYTLWRVWNWHTEVWFSLQIHLLISFTLKSKMKNKIVEMIFMINLLFWESVYIYGCIIAVFNAKQTLYLCNVFMCNKFLNSYSNLGRCGDRVKWNTDLLFFLGLMGGLFS